MQAGFVQIDAADAGGTQLGSGGQLVEDAVTDESGIHTVQGGGESVGDAGQPGDDLGELLDHPPAAQLGGVVRDRLEPQHAFALSVLRTPVKVGIRCCLRCLASFRHRAWGRWTAVGVEVERPQRSEDERPRGRRGSAANLAGRGRGKDVAVQVICCLLGEKNVLRETTSRVPAPSLIWVHGRGPAT